MITDEATGNRLQATIEGYLDDTLTPAQVSNALEQILASPREACAVILSIGRITAEFLKEAGLVPPAGTAVTYGFMVGGEDDGNPDGAAAVNTFGQILIALLNNDPGTAHTVAHEASYRLSTTSSVIGYALAYMYRNCHAPSTITTQKD